MMDESVPGLYDGLVNNRCGYVLGSRVDKVSDIQLNFERSTTTKYTVARCPKNFGNTDIAARTHWVQWDHKDKANTLISFDGIPFMILATKTLECQNGPDRNLLNKARHAEKMKDIPFAKRRFLKRDTKKLGCPAKLKVFEVVKFPDFKISSNTRRSKWEKSKALREALSQSLTSVNQERRLYVCLPSDDDHAGHNIGETGGVFQPIDSTVIQKIYELVGQGVRSVSEMRRHIRIYIENELFRNKDMPSRNNRRYFPSLNTIKNHMYNATLKQRISVMDQDNVEGLAQKWTVEGDKVKFRPFTGEEEQVCQMDTDENNVEEDPSDTIVTHARTLSSRLLFVHQTPWQQRLLLRYGQEMACLDATYKTTKYALPLYFLAVKTNVNYIVVAEFVVQDETTASITEALGVIKSWNSDWRPQNIITDLCQEEISAFEAVFPDCNVLICAFHREQAWDRWTSKKDNGVSAVKDKVLGMLRRLANSETEKTFQRAFRELEESKEWNENEKLRKWITGTWMRHKKRWVSAFRRQRSLVYVNTNNGLERQNGVFKNQYIQTLRKHSLGGMLKILRDEYLPDKFERYIDANSICSGQGRRYNSQIPEYLHRRPDYLVNHCMKRIASSMEIDVHNIQLEDEASGCFHVGSAGLNSVVYKVTFRTSNLAGFPTCECQDWMRWYLPCKHMLAVIQAEKWTWGQICEQYRESPFLTLDEQILFTCVSKDSVVEVDEEESQASNANNFVLPEPPLTVIPSKRQLIACCDLWASIKNMMYESVDATAVARLEEALRAARDDLERSLDKENGIVLTKSSVSSTKPRKKKKALPPLKVKRTWKHPFSQRHGSKAAMMRRMYKSRLSLDEMLKTNHPVRITQHTQSVTFNDEKMEVDVSHGYVDDSCTPPDLSVPEPPLRPTKVNNFTPSLSAGLARERRLMDPLLTFGSTRCSLLQIKSLEPTLTTGVLNVLKSVDPKFTIGWLYDDIIDAYFWCLKHSATQNVKVITAAVMMVVQHGLSSGRIWRGEDLSDTDWVFAPWNPAGNHWTLVAVNIKDRQVIYLNPLHATHQVYTDLLLDFLLPFLARFGWHNFSVLSPRHTLQKDSSSCGVFICWYARRLLHGQPLTDSLDANQMRVDIYQTIRGDCLQRLFGTHTRLSQCGICMDPSHDNMAQCTKCRQWHHLECLGISREEAQKRRVLHCPPL